MHTDLERPKQEVVVNRRQQRPSQSMKLGCCFGCSCCYGHESIQLSFVCMQGVKLAVVLSPDDTHVIVTFHLGLFSPAKSHSITAMITLMPHSETLSVSVLGVSAVSPSQRQQRKAPHTSQSPALKSDTTEPSSWRASPSDCNAGCVGQRQLSCVPFQHQPSLHQRQHISSNSTVRV